MQDTSEAQESQAHPPPLLVVGENVGAYVVVRYLGSGGFGEVYQVRHHVLQRNAALKVLHQRYSHDRVAVQRFIAEARAASRVRHPSIVEVYDFGELSNGRQYFVMELLEGTTLRIALEQRGHFEIEEAISILRAIASAVDAAHAAGVAHRDLKPDNIFLLADNGIKLIDFGLAKLIDESGPKVTLTHSGTVIGTPLYMAPEQCRGQRSDLPADIYSFGAVAYHVLTGSPPFSGDALELALQHVHASAPLPSCRVRSLPTWIDRLIHALMAKDPNMRPVSLIQAIDEMSSQTQIWRRLMARFSRFVLRPVYSPLSNSFAIQRRRRHWYITAVIIVICAATFGARLFYAPGNVHFCPPPSTTDVFVATDVPPGGNGSSLCPFTTITQALLTNSSSLVIHVAAGRYDSANGERFPLVIRGPIEIRGAGPDATIISGVGQYDGNKVGSTVTDHTLRATFVIGDHSAHVTLSALTMEAGSDTVGQHVGIACTRGNLHDFEGAIPPENTHLKNLAFGEGYHTAIVIAGEMRPTRSGCNIEIADLNVHARARGIWQAGCGEITGMKAPTGLRLLRGVLRGIGPNRHPVRDQASIGLLVWDCARRLVVEKSIFSDIDIGVRIVRHGSEGLASMEIIDNDFSRLSYAALELYRSVLLDRFDQNSVTHNPGAAIAIQVPMGEQPRIRARDNEFFHNGVALEIYGSGRLTSAAVVDFGRANDYGNNAFFCNHRDGERVGPDVILDIAGEPSATVQLSGNTWERVPPRVGRQGATLQNTDIFLKHATPPRVLFEGARKYPTQCMRR